MCENIINKLGIKRKKKTEKEILMEILNLTPFGDFPDGY